MGTERVRRDVYPRGPEGLEPEGGWKPGEPLVAPEALAAVREEAERVKVLDAAVAVARGEGAKAAEAIMAREKEGKAGQLMAFKSFLGSLEDLALRDASAVANAEETRLVLKLYRQEENGGPKPTSTYQTSTSFSAAEALGLGDPDFEGRAQAWAEKTGRFGRYQWRILGWAGGEQTLDTTYNVQVEPPPGYEAPRGPVVEVDPEAPRDPMASLREGLGIIALVKETIGGPAAAGKVDTDSIRAMARAEALLEADREQRKELRALEDRWEARIEKAEKEAHARGVVEGRRAAEDEFRPRLWELERKADGEHEPTILEEAARLVGGPEVVQSLVKAVITSMERPAPAVPPPGRPVVPLQRANPGPAVPPPVPSAAPAPAAEILPEPTRKEWRAALDDTESVLDLLDEHGEDTPDIQQLREVLEAFHAQGEADGPLGPWWKAWRQGIGQGVKDMLEAAEDEKEPEGDETMDLEAFKALLGRRLDEGAADVDILAELDRSTTPKQRAQWRGLLKWMPDDAAAAMLGEHRHRERLAGLLRAFQAGQ